MSDNFKHMISDLSTPLPDGFIDKPINLERLIAMVRQALGATEHHKD